MTFSRRLAQPLAALLLALSALASADALALEVVGSAKPGLFTVSFLDLEVDAGGIPIRVTPRRPPKFPH
ncbi:MAG: hypothetical protein F9K47_12220 [Burkholderiales bacterium]|nr:MAG: hypothetical protein F9K47_12220 [Burkholderiales bacterium]